jgi:uncharacterized alkaline shock family protein YloU|tara:strand:+ start:367 stop:627 length:261 start_codon:yes stop_codon:yes gene_type:complete
MGKKKKKGKSKYSELRLVVQIKHDVDDDTAVDRKVYIMDGPKISKVSRQVHVELAKMLELDIATFMGRVRLYTAEPWHKAPDIEEV